MRPLGVRARAGAQERACTRAARGAPSPPRGVDSAMNPLVATLVGLALAVPAAAEEAIEIKTEADRINYSMGYEIGTDFKRLGVEPDPAAVSRGMRDAVSGAQPLVTPEQMKAAQAELKRRVAEEARIQRDQEAQRRRAEGQAFLAENAKKEGVRSLPSGLQYRVIEEGQGKSPGPADQVTVHYTGTLVDGTVFDTSRARGEPSTFALDEVIKGWAEGLQLMKAGGKAQLVIPPDLAYGGRGRLADRTLIFDVELLEVGEPKDPQRSKDPHAAQNPHGAR